MSLFTDRRSLKRIGGFKAYAHQVGWSLWWRYELWRRASDRPTSEKTGYPIHPPERPRRSNKHLT